MDDKVKIPSRKTKRLENKMKKMKAYVELVQSNNQIIIGSSKKEQPDLNAESKLIKKKKGKTDLSMNSKVIKKKKKVKKKKLLESATMMVNEMSENKEPTPERNVYNQSSSVSSVVDCNYSQLKKMKRQIDKQKAPWPRIELTAAGRESQITVEDEERIPLTMKEVQSTVLNFLMPGSFPYPSKLGKLFRRNMVSHTVVAVIEGVSIGVLKKFNQCKTAVSMSKKSSNEESEIGFSDVNFHDITERNETLPDWMFEALPRTCSLLSPLTFEITSNFGSVPLEDILCVPCYNVFWDPVQKNGLTKDTAEKTEESNKSCEKGYNDCESVVDDTTNGESDRGSDDLPPSDCFDRRQLLLSPSELYLSKYPVPAISSYMENGFVFSKEEYEKVKPSSPMYGIDCEMCLSIENRLQLASISVVNEKLKLIYHKLVKPEKKIVNYLTRFSGITKEMLDGVTTTIYDVHNDLRNLMPPDAIFVGHSLSCDLKAMKMMHPYVIDSGLAYNLSFSKYKPSSLQVLTRLFLERQIQMDPGGHDPTEDAVAALELIQLKLKKGYTFGNVLEGYRLQNGLDPNPGASRNVSKNNFFNVFQHAVANRIKTAVLMTPSSAKSCHHILESVPKDRIDVQIIKENKALSQRTAEIAMSQDFTFLHMKMNSIKNADSKSKHREELRKLDKRLQRIYNGACQKSLVMYIFTGSEYEAFDDSSNGLFMCCIKKLKDISSSVT